MSRMKSIFAGLLLAAIVSIVPSAQAQTVKVVIAGSSAMWQTMALGAFGNPTSPGASTGTCSTQLTGCVSPTFHWTSASSGANEPFLQDNRSTTNNDPGPTWVVWDSATGTAGPNIWVYAKVDSVVGVRCYFAVSPCTLKFPTGATALAGANLIKVIWGSTGDTNLTTPVKNALNGGNAINVAATDIRPEDAAWAMARVNSQAGPSTAGTGHSDGLDGLGYNANYAPGVPATYAAGTNGVGNAILSGIPGSTQPANVEAFNITGNDPFTNTKVPAYTVTAVGAAPIVFVKAQNLSISTGLKNVTNATEGQLQQVFSGTNCDATAFGVSGGTGLNIFLREPLSGTMNTTEATVFRRPTVYPGNILGVSQETGVYDTVGLTLNNPLAGQAGTCTSTGNGARFRGIGTGEVIAGVRDSNATSGSCHFVSSDNTVCLPHAQDGIAYTFFSYGNVKNIAGSTAYGYITLNGVDPIFQSYGSTIDPGQPSTAGQLPLNAPVDSVCLSNSTNNFPCPETHIWANGFSFPNLRNGTYRAWSLLRTVATGTPNTNVGKLVKASQFFVVSSVPDYVPAVATTCNVANGGCNPAISDVGLKLLRSHYQQRDGNSVELGAPGVATNSPEKGGDMGGDIIPTTIGALSIKQVQLIQNATFDSNGNVVNLGPVVRP